MGYLVKTQGGCVANPRGEKRKNYAEETRGVKNTYIADDKNPKMKDQ